MELNLSEFNSRHLHQDSSYKKATYISGFFIGYMFILRVYQIQLKMKKFFNIS